VTLGTAPSEECRVLANKALNPTGASGPMTLIRFSGRVAIRRRAPAG
jgi:hypothetical protein